MSTLFWAGCAVLLGLMAAPASQAVDDPTVRAAVERYYRALEAEDVDAYLALWSKSAQAPQRESLKFLFESVDDRMFEIQIVRAVSAGERLRVRVSMRRERTRPGRGGGPPFVTSEVTSSSLTLVKEGDDWKVVSEGSPADDLAGAYVTAATSEAREALLEAESDLLNTLLVVAAARIASQAAMRQQYARAQFLYERVVELAKRTGSRKEEGEALQNLGNALYFQRKLPEALATYEQRLALEEERGDEAAVAPALTGIATIKYSVAEYTEALKRYRDALAIHERLDDRPSIAITLISTGNVRYLQGDYSGAIADYSRSRDLYRGFPDSDGEARALQGLGRTFSAQGNYAAALSAFAGVLAEGRARADRSRQGTAMQSLAEVHLRLGNVDAARAHFEESRDHFVALKNLSGAGRVWQGLGMTELMAGRFDAAERAYRTSTEICAGITDAECSAHATVGLAFALYAQDKFPESIALYRKAIEALAALGFREAAARAEIGLSQALTSANDFTAAVEAATRARHAAMALTSDDVVWRALTAEARALRKSGAAEKALAVARAAAGVVERMHAEALDKPATAIPSDASSVFVTLAVLQAETGDAPAAWSSASRMRAIDLRNTLAVNEREIGRGMTPEEREHERVAASELLSLLAQASRERQLPKPDAARIAALDERIAAASTVRNTWMQQLYARLPELRLWRGLMPSPATSDLLPVLTPGTVLIDFLVDDDTVLLVVVSAASDAGVAAYPTTIRRRVLAERVNALLQAATLREPAEWRKAAAEIARLLPTQAMPLLAGASRVIVVPDDVIWRVPFEALPLGDAYLGDRSQVAYAGSIAALVRGAALESVAGRTMVAVSSPELMPSTRERLRQTAPGWAIRGEDAGLRETTSIASVYADRATVLTAAAATEPAVRAHTATASTLHVAAPFRMNGASPLFSPILLSGDPSSRAREDDGALETHEVMNLSLRARVAIFTDGSATSMLDGAAASDALQWAWLAAGVPSIGIARWTADPAASDALLQEFHRRLSAGEEPGEALHAARGTIRARREWAAPFYWAGWVMLGSPAVSWAPWNPWFVQFLRF